MVRELQRQKAVRILPAPIDTRHETAIPQLNCDIFLTRRYCEGSMIRQNAISVYQETPFITMSGLVLRSLVGLQACSKSDEINEIDQCGAEHMSWYKFYHCQLGYTRLVSWLPLIPNLLLHILLMQPIVLLEDFSGRTPPTLNPGSLV